MNRWARIQLVIAGLGTLLFVLAGRQGLSVTGHPESFPLHTQLALVATLTVLLGLLWIVVYLAASRRFLRTRAGMAPEELRAISRSARGALVAAAVAAGATVSHFLLAGRLFGRPETAGWHLWSALTTAALLGVALVLGARGLSRHQRLVEARKGTERMLDSAGS